MSRKRLERSRDTTKASFLGMTAHFIDVQGETWKLRAEVIGFKALSGAHSGENLGRYAVGLLDRVGIMDKNGSKACGLLSRFCPMIAILPQLYTATLDNTSNNNTTCQEIEDIHRRRGLSRWNSSESQLPYVHFNLSIFLHLKFLFFSTSCLGHVINISNVDVMGHITKIAAVENSTAIWEYDPTQRNNRVLGGSLDVIAAIRTLVIKVRALFRLSITQTLIPWLRFKHLDSKSSISIVLRFDAVFLRPSKSPCTVISVGGQLSKCLTRLTSFDRYCIDFLLFLLDLHMQLTANCLVCVICRWNVWTHHYRAPRRSYRKAHTLVGIQDVGARLAKSIWCTWDISCE